MEEKIINNIKSLSLDMINEANSGHPGIVLSSANILYTLYYYHMSIDLENDKNINRDRFVMSAGHGSALLYSVLYYVGLLELNDLKKFRQFNSNTPGHPEIKTKGVDASTGPLGQGFATSVGMAIAQKYLKEINEDIDYNIYTLCGDGDLMEGITAEAASLAGQFKLDNLIVLYDSNKMSLDGNTEITFTENVREIFEAKGWYTTTSKNKVIDIHKAINRAKRSKLPSLIEVSTIIGEGSLLENTNKVHGKPLNKDDLKQIKKKLELPNDPFYVDEKALKHFRKKLRLKHKTITLENKNISFDKLKIDLKDKQSLRDINKIILNYISKQTNLLIGGSADLSSSTKTYLDKLGNFTKENYKGRNIFFGVREHAMGAILNGLALSNLKPFGSTFLSFEDYLKPAIRMSCLMNLPVTYIFTHDSITVGEDGPTHQPIEQLSNLRSIPNLTVYRPADYHELVGCYKAIFHFKNPSALILTRDEIYNLKTTNTNETLKGAYIVKKENKKIDAVIITSGSELSLSLMIALELSKENIDLRVVSMPSLSLFEKMNNEYQNKIIPLGTKKIVIEASYSPEYRNYVTNEKYLLTLKKKFGISANKEDVLNYMNFTKEDLKEKIKELI